MAEKQGEQGNPIRSGAMPFDYYTQINGCPDETVLWRGAFAMFTNTNLLKLYPTHGALFHAGWLPNMQKREKPQFLPFFAFAFRFPYFATKSAMI